jgi:hypothetical protein
MSKSATALADQKGQLPGSKRLLGTDQFPAGEMEVLSPVMLTRATRVRDAQGGCI